MNKIVFTCPECGGDVAEKCGPGRTAEYRRGAPRLPIPDDLVIPECQACGERFESPEIEERLTEQLHQAFLKWQGTHLSRLVESLTEKHGVAIRDVARAAGVTPSHLSHVRAGSAEASITLQRLLEAYVAAPAEFARHVGRQPRTAPAGDLVFLVPVATARRAWTERAHGAPGQFPRSVSEADGKSDPAEAGPASSRQSWNRMPQPMTALAGADTGRRKRAALPAEQWGDTPVTAAGGCS